MKIEARKHGIVLKEVYSGVLLETAEGNAIGVCMRDDTLEINVIPKGSAGSNWWRVDMQNGTIVQETRKSKSRIRMVNYHKQRESQGIKIRRIRPMSDQVKEYERRVDAWAELCKDYWRLMSQYEVQYARAVLDAKPGWVESGSETEFIMRQKALIAAAPADVVRLYCDVDKEAARLKLDLLGELIKKAKDNDV